MEKIEPDNAFYFVNDKLVVADPITQEIADFELSKRHGVSMESIEALRKLKAKHSVLFEDIESLPPGIKQIAEFTNAMLGCEEEDKSDSEKERRGTIRWQQ